LPVVSYFVPFSNHRHFISKVQQEQSSIFFLLNFCRISFNFYLTRLEIPLWKHFLAGFLNKMLLSNFKYNFLQNSPQSKRKRNYSDEDGSPRKRKHSEEVEGVSSLENGEDSFSPLDLNIVLAKICSFLPLQDLGTCRLVNRLWNEEATPYFSSHSRMEIDNLSLDSGRTSRDFWSKLGSLCSSHLNITRGDIRDPDLYNIFQKFGNKIRTLEVDAVAETEDIAEANLWRRNYFLFVTFKIFI
jgi:hypothetical protein